MAVTKSPVAAAASTAIATNWSVARRVSPVTIPRTPEISVGIPTIGCGQASAKLANLPLIRLQSNQQCPKAEKPDANKSCAQPHADAAAFLGSKGDLRPLGAKKPQQTRRLDCQVTHWSSSSGPGGTGPLFGC